MSVDSVAVACYRALSCCYQAKNFILFPMHFSAIWNRGCSLEFSSMRHIGIRIVMHNDNFHWNFNVDFHVIGNIDIFDFSVVGNDLSTTFYARAGFVPNVNMKCINFYSFILIFHIFSNFYNSSKMFCKFCKSVWKFF